MYCAKCGTPVGLGTRLCPEHAAVAAGDVKPAPAPAPARPTRPAARRTVTRPLAAAGFALIALAVFLGMTRWLFDVSARWPLLLLLGGGVLLLAERVRLTRRAGRPPR